MLLTPILLVYFFTFQSCDDRNPAHSWCSDCEDHLCDDCVKAHQRVKITKDHNITTIVVQPRMRSSSSASADGSSREPVPCRDHPSEQLLAFCDPCDVLVCEACCKASTGRHEGHAIKRTHAKAPEVKTALQQAVADTRLKKNMLDENRSILGNKLSELNIKVSHLIGVRT